MRYRSRKAKQEPLRRRLRELAATHVRYGYRRLTVLLRREGWVVNAKRVYRLYDQENLKVRTNGNVIFSESFSNDSPSPDPLGSPTPGPPFTVNLATSILGDTYALWTNSGCPPANVSDSFNQQWTPNVGGAISGGVTYSLTTVISASQSTNSQGLPSFNVSIGTP